MKPALAVTTFIALAPWLGGCAGNEREGDDGKRAPDDRPLSQRTEAELRELMLRKRQGDPPPPAPAGTAAPGPSRSEPIRPPPVRPEVAAPPPSEPPLLVPGPAAKANEPSTSAPPRSPAEIRETLGGFIRRLRESPKSAEDAFRELWEVEAELVPDVILEVENRAPSQLHELKIFVEDKEKFAKEHVRIDDKTDQFVYDLPGMGNIAYDSIASGPTRGGKGLKLVIKRFDKSPAFTVGEAMRASLLNRFRSSDYPAGDHRTDVVGWWQRFYQKVRSDL